MKRQIQNLFSVSALLVLMVIAGCQSAPEPQPIQTQEPQLPTPFSNGPTTPPGVKGPTAAPPGTKSYSQQAVSETESIRYTLPTTPTVQVKQ